MTDEQNLASENEIPITEKEKNVNYGAIIAVILLIILCIAGYFFTNKGQKNKPDVGSDIDAVLVCQKWVKENLKAPSTAEFPQINKAKITKLADTTWRVVSYVDAQNSFGAMIRTYYDCETTYLGKDKWQLLKLEFE